MEFQNESDINVKSANSKATCFSFRLCRIVRFIPLDGRDVVWLLVDTPQESSYHHGGRMDVDS